MSKSSPSRGTLDRAAVGVLPAAGLGRRLGIPSYPKELLPVVYESVDQGLLPRPLIASSLAQLARGGVRRCVVVISERKLELARVVGDGEDSGIHISYVLRNVARGLADAIDAALPWVCDSDLCLALPDTMIAPTDAVAHLRAARRMTNADLVLGVFPTSTPELLGPVRITATGGVLEVLEKPAVTDLANTWGLALWSPRFSALLHETVHGAAADQEVGLGEVFNEAVRRAWPVQAICFTDGSYVDLGTPRGLASFWRRPGISLIDTTDDRQTQINGIDHLELRK